ncbi:MAG TPA: trypsin-like peptidase domain-containing protein [Planctomycetaceae bacterium]|jgi:serine protease Do|nr:trypsin-like peptidase domain-containing protein [Planctomycetaceae bacterium]
MLRRLTVRWSVPTLLVGIAIGLGLSSWPWVRAVHARPDDRSLGEAGAADRVRSPLIEASRELARVAAEVTPSVVHIESKVESPTRGMLEETGSGAVVTSPKVPGYFVVTNRHVVGDASDLGQISVRLSDGRAFHPTRRWIDRETDLAVLSIDAQSAKPIAWGDSDRLEIGNIVLAVGSPFGLSQSVTMGIVSARGRALRLEKKNALVNQDFIQTDAAINFGNSGGPLIDVNGQLIGINTAIASNSGGNDGIGFSIPSNLVRRVVNDLLERGEVRRAYLGVMLDPDFTPDKAKELKLDRVHGARITEVYQGSPAARAGLLADDVVLSFDGIEVIDENHLINLVSLTKIGRKVVLVVLRDGKRVTIEVHLSDRHEMNEQSEVPRRPGMGSLVEPLGLTLHEVNRDLARQLGFAETTRGLLVLRVDPKSTLAGSVDVYDVLEEIGRTPVTTVTDAQNALFHKEARGEVLLRFTRRSGGAQRSHIVVWRRELKFPSPSPKR